MSAGYKLAAFDSIGSTNAEALARARDGERGPIWFVTSEQTAGRGRRHRPWIAPRGNLACSILEVIEISPAVAATLGFAAGLALEAALQKVSLEASLRAAGSDEMKFMLKWPNDVLAGNKKLAGILLEAEAVADRLAVVVGIGTNVVAAPEGTPTPAVSLGALGVDIGAEELFARIVRRLGGVSRHLGQWTRVCRNPAEVAGARGGAGPAGFDQVRRLDVIRYVRHHRSVRLHDCRHIRRQAGPDIGRRRLFRRCGVSGSGMMARPDELTFAPLGGVGEIGMNLSIYGLGNRHQRSWLAVDLGVSFGDEEHLPGIDLIMPDIRFLQKERKNLVGLVLTHAHEDHFGAIIDLWPKLKCPIYATKFQRRAVRGQVRLGAQPAENSGDGGAVGRPHRSRPVQCRVHPGRAFDPESHALAIHTSAGTVLHTGDWKIDPTPIIGVPTDERRLRELGDAGVLALVGDSTNAVREGRSPSEAEVAKTITELVKAAKGRVAVTTFASNVARLRAVADAARAAGREVVVVGRAMERVVQVARETGYLDGVQSFRSADVYGHLPADKVLALCTGSQGEPRAALARIANDDHPQVTLNKGDCVIFSSRTIPGNEKAVGGIINGLIGQGVEVITDRTHLVHVSGHPRRDELRDMISWVRPQLLIPVHGEALHLFEHAKLARAAGVPKVLICRNGDLVGSGPGDPGVIEQLPSGRIYKDGSILEDSKSRAVVERRRLAFAGCAFVGVAVTDKGELADDPEVDLVGIPEKNTAGEVIDDIVFDVVVSTVEGLPRARRRDPDALAELVRRAVRAAINEQWGKKPLCYVHVLTV